MEKLYDIYGLSWKLLASFWDTFTSFLTHRNVIKNMRENANKTKSNENIQSEEIQFVNKGILQHTNDNEESTIISTV